MKIYNVPSICSTVDILEMEAHPSPTPFWAKKLTKKELTAYQASTKGGILELELLSNNRMKIIGEVP